MKLTIQLVENLVGGQVPDRRTLGALEFFPKDIGDRKAFALPDTPVPVDADSWLVVHSGFVPDNHALSVMIGHHTGSKMTHVFSAMGWWEHSPGGKTVYYAFYLPAGQFIELYFTPDDRPPRRAA